MEVPGYGASACSVSSSGSEDAPDELLCAQCQESGQSAVPSAFCSYCNDYLCNNCTVQHKNLRATKYHQLLEGTNMPKVKPRDNGESKCTDHPDELVKFYCMSHDQVGCVLCITESHGACKQVASISKLSKDFQNSKELHELKMRLKQRQREMESYRNLIREYLALNSTWYDQSSIRGFDAYRRQVEASLDRLQERVYDEAGELKQENQMKLDSLKESLKSLIDEIESLGDEVELLEKRKKMDQLFITVTKYPRYIKEHEQKFENLKKTAYVQRYKFSSDLKVQQVLGEMVDSGSMKTISLTIPDFRYSGEVSINASDDKTVCGVTCITAVNETTIVVSDSFNCSLKVIDTERKKITSKRTFASMPAETTTLPGSRIAAAFPDEAKIRLFSIDGLERRGKIRVDGLCLALASSDDMMFVSYKNPGKIQMLDLKGCVLKTFFTDSEGQQMFNQPYSLGLSPDHRFIYVQDFEKRTWTCLATDGSVQWVYENHRIRCLNGGMTTAEDGHIYISNTDTDSVHVLDPWGTRVREISLKEFDIRKPSTLCYCSKRNALYVCSSDPRQRDVIRQLSLQ